MRENLEKCLSKYWLSRRNHSTKPPPQFWVLFHFKLSHALSSFSDARERSKESFSELEPLRCLPTRLPKKTAHTNLPHMLAVFLTHASPPSHIAADSEIINAALFDSHRNRRVRAGEGFNRRVSISVLYSNAHDLRSIGAPKLSARAAGIESVRYDFDKISLVTFPASIKTLKSGILYSGTFSERK